MDSPANRPPAGSGSGGAGAWRQRLHPFRPRLVEAVQGYDRRRFLADVGAGLTVGVVALPLAMAFAIASGLKPEQGLITAIVGGLLISMLGGSSVQIGGPAGAFIVVVYGIVERHGVGGLLISTLFAGLLLVLMGWLKLGGLVRFIPVPIVTGFTNGIAVLIALSQVKDLLGLSIEKMPADFLQQLDTLARRAPDLSPAALAVGLGSLVLVVLWPKSYTMPVQPKGWLPHLRRWASHVPATLVALVAATAATVAFNLPVETIGSRFGGIPSSLPLPSLPDWDWSTAKQLVTPTITLALLGAIESLLCARVADNLRPAAPRHDPNQELMAQGMANLVVPFFGGLPATGTIARTVTNVRAGATSPVAGMVHAATLAAVVLVAAPLAEHVPLPALAGILLFVAWNMGEWREFARLRHFPLPYRATLLGTFALTVVFDLTVAVEVGLLMACLFFVVRMGQLFEIRPLRASPHSGPLPPGVQAVELFGSLFFAAVGKLEELSERLPADTRCLVLEMHRLVSMDATGLDSLEQLHANLERRGIRLVLACANPQPRDLMERSGFLARLGPSGLVDDLASALQAGERAAREQATSAAAPDTRAS